MCIDYRKLNNLTVKDRYPLPRIDDQLDRLSGCKVFTSLDMRAGYHQIPVEEESKHYTAFVTPEGSYEFNRMPFGLSNAPAVFQRLINRVLAPAKALAAIYLDDVLIPTPTAEENLENLRKIFTLLRGAGLTLNLEKCSFLMDTVEYLGYQVAAEGVRPGENKINAVARFGPPTSTHQVRQFLGLTGYFRHFIKDYALISRRLTIKTKKDYRWEWTHEDQLAFETLKTALTSRPVLALYNPKAETEIHTDASMHGLAGILLQVQQDSRLHPVAYFSRQTSKYETKYHSYELETLAVVETLRKFRVYLLGLNFKVITDCNSLKATQSKKEIIPRIARWWLQLQEYNFTVHYRPGNRMQHVDCLSRNPLNLEKQEQVLRIEQSDWVLSAQLTDEKISHIKNVLSKPPETEDERHIYKEYVVKNERVYKITARGLLWVIPRGMRQQVVRAAHDEMGHFAAEKTLLRLCRHYWFPRMREYVERYIACCVRCLMGKKKTGPKEGFLHPIEKGKVPFHTIHIDHLGPFPKSSRGNQYLITLIEAFTKFVVFEPVKSTATKFVTKFLTKVFYTYGSPNRTICDQGSSFTAKSFKKFCADWNVKLIFNAVATPRANGQNERFNRTISSALVTSTEKENKWDEAVPKLQFAINTSVSKATGKTPFELLFGYQPHSGVEGVLSKEVSVAPSMVEDIVKLRDEVAVRISTEQQKQKSRYDKRRKRPKLYRQGDLVLIEKTELPQGTSRKLVDKFTGPMVVKRVLPSDRYIVTDMEGSNRTQRKANYEKVVAVDRMKPWIPGGGVSDETDSESGEDGVLLSSSPSSEHEQNE